MNQNNAGFTDQHDPEPHPGKVAHAVDWLNEKLMSTLGPPPVGPYGPLPVPDPNAACPVCAHPMSEHRIDHSMANAVLECPVPHEGLYDHVDDAPLNEVGQPKRQP